MDAKELKKLVKVCRDLGVTRYKGPDFEFELGDAPRKETSVTAPRHQYEQSEVETDMPSDMDLLFWSAVNPNSVEEKENES